MASYSSFAPRGAHALAVSLHQHQLQRAVDLVWLMLVVMAGLIAAQLLPSVAYASTIETVLCQVIALFHETLGKSLASIAVCILGIGALLGKISWPLAMTTVLGIVVMLSAGNLAGTLGLLPPGSTPCNGTPAPANVNALTQPFCMIAGIMSGRVGDTAKLIATVGIQILALMAFFGRLQWSTAITVAIGVALLIGAGGLINVTMAGGGVCEFFDASFNRYFGTTF